jgi:N-glycosylase/DNA lyase
MSKKTQRMLKIRKDKHASNQIKKIYSIKKNEISFRLKEFENIWSARNDEEIFTELAFCILTPQSKAKSCWDAIVKLKDQNLLLKGNAEQIKQVLNCVRFKNKKTQYLANARKLFMKDGRVSIRPFLNIFADIYECREWLVKNIDGLGYKEASHFLRNIGFGEKIAILDRHVLRNLNKLGIIEEVPGSISRAKYMELEKKMLEFSKQIDIPLSHLDLLLWYKETGEIFK